MALKPVPSIGIWLMPFLIVFVLLAVVQLYFKIDEFETIPLGKKRYGKAQSKKKEYLLDQ